MQKSELIYIASKAVAKRWTYEQLYYGDDMYGNEKFTDDVWEYVEECEAIGTLAFKDMYKEYKLYSGL